MWLLYFCNVLCLLLSLLHSDNDYGSMIPEDLARAIRDDDYEHVEKVFDPENVDPRAAILYAVEQGAIHAFDELYITQLWYEGAEYDIDDESDLPDWSEIERVAQECADPAKRDAFLRHLSFVTVETHAESVQKFIDPEWEAYVDALPRAHRLPMPFVNNPGIDEDDE